MLTDRTASCEFTRVAPRAETELELPLGVCTIVTVDIANCVASVLFVAVTMIVAGVGTEAGAVYNPFASICPGLPEVPDDDVNATPHET